MLLQLLFRTVEKKNLFQNRFSVFPFALLSCASLSYAVISCLCTAVQAWLLCVCVSLQFIHNSLKIHLELQHWLVFYRCYQAALVNIHRGKIIVFIRNKMVARRKYHRPSKGVIQLLILNYEQLCSTFSHCSYIFGNSL